MPLAIFENISLFKPVKTISNLRHESTPFIITPRLACRILSTTNISIAEVVASCGFINTSHFIAKFRRHMDMTPHQYRVSNRL